MTKIKRAIVSVYNKTGLKEFGRGLVDLGIDIVSTGGTFRRLRDAGLPVTYVSGVTEFPEILEGRVKTLHPRVHGGILARRSVTEDMEALDELGIQPIDLVVVNLYPFADTVARAGVTVEEATESIDIGGPTMIRAAAKNFRDVTVVVNPDRYPRVLAALQEGDGAVPETLRASLAQEAFEHTSTYDRQIAQYFHESVTGDDETSDGAAESAFPGVLSLSFEKVQDLRYGENPHQAAAFYRDGDVKSIQAAGTTLVNARQLHGKPLSFNNINDTAAALEMVKSFAEPAVAAIKHTNPSGLAVGSTVDEAYQKAYESDPVSIFGGIVACNRPVTADVAARMAEIFLEVIVAPSFSQEALDILTRKKNLRLLQVGDLVPGRNWWELKRVAGGLLVQDADMADLDENALQVVTCRTPTDAEMKDLRFGWVAVKHVKSNAIVLAKDGATVGVGAGQMNRILPTQMAIEQACEKAKGSVLASDAFFPFSDVVEAAVKAGVTAIIQPGGSIRDQDSIDVADANDIAMVFTGMRHFKH